MPAGPRQHTVRTDVLVIGGGLSGCFAAMKARERGVGVTVIEKEFLPHSGSNATGIDHFPYCYIPEVHGPSGRTVEDFVRDHTLLGNGIVDQELLEMMWRDSYDRLMDLERIGVKIRFEKTYPWNFGYEPGDYPDEPKFRIVPWFGFKFPPALNIEGRHIKKRLHDRLRELRVRVLNRKSVQGLLKRDGRVVGAIGFDVLNGDLYMVEAKAVVVATGFLSRLYPTRNNFSNRLVPADQTAEGQVMALRAGAELAVMEEYPRAGQLVRLGAARLKNWSRSLPATPSGYPAGRIVNAAGEEMPSNLRSFDRSYDEELERRQVEWVRRSMREGTTPFYWDATAATEEEREYAEWSCVNEGGGFGFFIHLKEDLAADLSTHQIELDPPIMGERGKPLGFQLTSPSGVVINTRAETRVPGLYVVGEAAYGVYFPSSPWAYATGARAGSHAAEYAATVGHGEIDQDQAEEARERLFSPLRVKAGQGVTWQEMSWEIGNIAKSYLLRPTPYGLDQGLGCVEALKHEQLRADNAHELMRGMETLSLLAVIEMFLRSARFPRRQDEWRVLSLDDGGMTFTTRPIAYRYPVSLPG